MTRSFLKWAGGKYKILNQIKQHLPQGKRLIEPFVGAGTVFLNIKYKKYILADANEDLINLFNTLKIDGHDFIKTCQTFFTAQTNTPEKYYAFRDTFNEASEKKLRSALFIYLNRHCYNGLCRYNSDGVFNVPFGEYKKPVLPIDRMEFFIEKAKTARFIHQDFALTMEQAKPGDIIYCDPPYVPLSNTAYFTAYSQLCFDKAKQIQLAEEARKAAQRGIPVIISNHDTPFTRELYKGAKISSFDVSRTISSKTHKRVPVKEIIAVFNPTSRTSQLS